MPLTYNEELRRPVNKDVHETFSTETRPRRWELCPRRDREETLWVRDETETETLQVAETFGEKQ